MKRFACILLIIAASIGVISCQMTPSAPIVQSKNDGKFEDSINAIDSRCTKSVVISNLTGIKKHLYVYIPLSNI